MAAPGAPSTAEPVAVTEATPMRSGPPSSPVAVVWCRQVDNEAESPGYTIVPEEFPGSRETLEAIRIVGNLTVNVADTQDYWDPDPAQPLSYYPNLFLYPAAGGRYTCVGRMFLSTEDRPRLGMKTIVLDTAQLLANHEFGSTVVRWHASMGGARPGSRLPPVPDPSLYPVVGEGFLFQRGTTDPVVLVASEQWESAVQAILELVRVLPSSLVAPAAFLCFPYFLPAAKTDLKEFSERTPLALALMRVARGEAAGERHAKRMAGWEAAATVRDLTDGIPSSAGRGKEVVPLVLQYVRDREEARLRPISQRVDLVELPKLRQRMGDPERSGGKDRRREMWRIGTAMESAALLLAKARGRHVPVSVETAKRAQEYLDARLPAPGDEVPVAVALAPSPAVEATPGTHHPPWLQRNDNIAPIRVDRVEVVPVSHSDDPSLLPAPAPTAVTSAPAAPAPSPGPVAPLPAPTPVDVAALKAELERNVARWVETRLSQFTPPPPAPTALAEEIDRRLDAKLAARPAAPTAADLQALEARFTALLNARLAELPRPAPPPDPASIDARVQGLLDARLRALPPPPAPPDPAALDARTGAIVDARLKAMAAPATPADLDALAARLTTQLDARLGSLPPTVAPAELAGLEARFAQQLDARLRALPPSRTDAEIAAVVSAAAAPLAARLLTIESRPSETPEAAARAAERISAEVARQLERYASARLAELAPKWEETARAAGEAAAARGQETVARSADRLKVEIAAASEDLRQGLQAQLDLHLREARDRAAADTVRLEARLEETLQRRFSEEEAHRTATAVPDEARFGELVDQRLRELEERLPTALTAAGARLPAYLDARTAEMEVRLAARQEAISSEVRDAQAAAAAELQVRLQAYFDQRMREQADRQRDTSVELLARAKGELDAEIAHLAESLPVQQAIRAQFLKLSEADRAERDRGAEERVVQSELRLRNDFLTALHRLEALEQTLEDRGKDLRDVESSVRADIGELDRRTAILSERLVPVVRKTWTRVDEVERAMQSGTGSEAIPQLRRELQRELHRLENELTSREAALRDRMETAIANQGRVWLTLIRQLSDLRGERSAPLGTLAPLEEAPEAAEPAAREEVDDLEELPELLKGRRRSTAAAPSLAPPLPEAASDDEAPPRRRRARPPPSRAGIG